MITKDTLIKDSGLSTRTINLIHLYAKEFGVETRFGEIVRDIEIGALEGFPLGKLIRLKGFGKSSLRELRNLLDSAGVNLNMENSKDDRYDGTIIYFNRYTKEGKLLYDLARILEKQDPEILIK